MKVGIFYGSTTGNAQAVAEALGAALGAEVASASAFRAEAAQPYDLLILGSSTWGDGELQDDWQSALPELTKANLAGKCVAVFGVGDASGWADSFVDAMKDLYDAASAAGATMIGAWPTDGYEFSSSRAVVNGAFVGLAIDDSNQGAQTPERVKAWAELLQKQAGA